MRWARTSFMPRYRRSIWYWLDPLDVSLALAWAVGSILGAALGYMAPGAM